MAGLTIIHWHLEEQKGGEVGGSLHRHTCNLEGKVCTAVGALMYGLKSEPVRK